MPRRFTDRDLAIFRSKNGEPDIAIPPKPRKKRGNEESRQQMALIRWWQLKHKEFNLPIFALFSIPNGGWRDPVGASILKKEGQRNGVSDLFLMAARGGSHGMFLEMKCEGGRISDEQHDFAWAATVQGYKVVTAWSYDQAVQEITSYLKCTDTKK